MIEHEINKLNTFILGWQEKDTTFCDEIIDFWDKSHNKKDGSIGTSNDINAINKDVKESVDVMMTVEELSKLKYATILKQCVDNYSIQYEHSICGGYELYPNMPIQYYPVGGGYKEWHCERMISNFPSVARHLVFMTYLNDLEDGGTEFYYQNIRVKAQKGLTLIWPSDWTFTHRSQVSPTKEKYIITGWFQLMEMGKLDSYLKRQL